MVNGGGDGWLLRSRIGMRGEGTICGILIEAEQRWRGGGRYDCGMVD